MELSCFKNKMNQSNNIPEHTCMELLLCDFFIKVIMTQYNFIYAGLTLWEIL